jgi:hypothetical protein
MGRRIGSARLLNYRAIPVVESDINCQYHIPAASVGRSLALSKNQVTADVPGVDGILATSHPQYPAMISSGTSLEDSEYC